MKNFKRILALLVSLLMILTAFTACSDSKKSSDKDDDNKEKITAEKSTLSSDFIHNSNVNNANGQEDGEIPDTEIRTLVMATNTDFPPYEYYQGGLITGIDIEIAELIAGELGAELEITDMDYNGIIGAVQNGTADFGMAGIAVTADRSERVDFTDSYITNTQMIVVMQGSDISDAEDLYGKNIGVVADSTADVYVTDDYGEDCAVRCRRSADVLMELKSGTVDAVIVSDTVAERWMLDNDSIAVIGTPYVEEEYAIAVAKENTELLNQINAAIAKLEREGKIQAIADKYIK